MNSLNLGAFDLPIIEVVDDIKNQLHEQSTLIVKAPPGAGKSTLLPLTLLHENWLQGKKIIMLEPRRLAAKTIAMRMADLLNEEVGATIGYRIRFEQKVSATTKLEVVTEGILTRMLQHDNALEEVGLVIFDEFHERSLHADLALALCREAQQILRPDLRIMVMSATLNMPQLTSLLQAPVVVSEGKQYPVEIIYNGETDLHLLPELMAKTIADALNKYEGDVLAFLPGEGEIQRTATVLQEKVKGVLIHPLYGQLPHQAQLAAILPDKNGRRKIVLATSIAETSLTIEGIKIVVDSGYSRVSVFDPKSGLSRLETLPITKDSANQRAGRAGRLSSGVCLRMWTKATHERLREHKKPEIEEADLTSLMLTLFDWGIDAVQKLAWVSPPPSGAVKSAIETLSQLNAISSNKITEHGKALNQLPCHPRIAHMLLKAKEDDCVALAADIAAIIEERDPLPKDSGIDINLRIELLRRSRKAGKLIGRLKRIEQVASQYRSMLQAEIDNDTYDINEAGLLLAYAYPERIACARTGNNAQFQLANGKIAVAGHRDDLANEPWLAVAHMDARDGLGKIFLAAPLHPKDLRPMVVEKEMITWDLHKGGLIATKDLRLGNIILQSKPMHNADESLIRQAIAEVIKKEGEHILDWNEHVLQLCYRIMSLLAWNNPNEKLPVADIQTLLENNMEWLAPYYDGIKRNEDFKKIPLYEALWNSLSYEQQLLVNNLAPSTYKVPSGSHIKIQYFSNGESPVLAVRLQEIFGVTETPKINNGKTSLLIHLLSPGFKPVQVTSDLKSFWQHTYFEVRKELKRRYPKHAWPENPLEATPVAKGGVRR